jgi:hypothetical protein
MNNKTLTHIGGTKPGNPKAVKLRQAIADGFTISESPKRVNTNWMGTGKSTGVSKVPGLTKGSKGSKKGK